MDLTSDGDPHDALIAGFGFKESFVFYWASWIQPTNDYRPITYPPNNKILGWWCSGYNQDGAILCAMILACSEETAKKCVLIDWPEAINWRFCDRRDDLEISDRWRLEEWMKVRFDEAKNVA